MASSIRHDLTLTVKRLLYGRRGEPYRIGGRTLRYLPGTRPVRAREPGPGRRVRVPDRKGMTVVATMIRLLSGNQRGEPTE